MYALLPMKEHSERIPEKNFRLLNDKPFFFYIADTLKATGLFTKLVIDTDGKLIEDLAKERYGDWVVIIQRPEELCGDYVAMNEIIAHDINILGIENDFMQTHSTNPFLTSKTIQKATEMYLSGKSSGAFDSLFSANELKTRLYDKDMAPLNHSPAELIRTQDLETIYEENSNFYFFSGWIRPSTFSKADSAARQATSISFSSPPRYTRPKLPVARTSRILMSAAFSASLAARAA